MTCGDALVSMLYAIDAAYNSYVLADRNDRVLIVDFDASRHHRP